MGIGAYSDIFEPQLDALMAANNGLVSDNSTFSGSVLSRVNTFLFNNNPTFPVPFWQDDSGQSATLGSGYQLFGEGGSTGASTMTFTSDGQEDVIVLENLTGNVNIVDLGSFGDTGDIIVGGIGADNIRVTQGNNFVVAGAGQTTIEGGSGDDTLVGGGDSSLVAGSGEHVRLKGGMRFGAHDTLIGGSGQDTIRVFQGDNSLVAGLGPSTLYGGTGSDTLIGGGHSSLDGGTGNDSMVGGATTSSSDTIRAHGAFDIISVTAGNNFIISSSGEDSIYSGDVGSGNGSGGDTIKLIHGGNADVTIGSGPGTDTVLFGGTQGDDNIKTQGAVDVWINSSEQLSSESYSGGSLTLSFQDGQNLTISGPGHVTITFNGF